MPLPFLFLNSSVSSHVSLSLSASGSAVESFCIRFACRPIAHGGGESALEFDFTPILTIEGHGGFDTNLEGDPKHYAIDGLFGGVFEWGLGNGGSFAIEAAVGPALVWGEAEHFCGKVHVHDDHDGHEAHDHDEHDHHEAWRSKKAKRGAKHEKQRS